MLSLSLAECYMRALCFWQFRRSWQIWGDLGGSWQLCCINLIGGWGHVLPGSVQMLVLKACRNLKHDTKSESKMEPTGTKRAPKVRQRATEVHQKCNAFSGTRFGRTGFEKRLAFWPTWSIWGPILVPAGVWRVSKINHFLIKSTENVSRKASWKTYF